MYLTKSIESENKKYKMVGFLMLKQNDKKNEIKLY